MDPVTAICTGGNLPRTCTSAVTVEAGNAGRCRPDGCLRRAGDQLKLSPQAQELPALGLSMVKPCFSMVSAKSIVAPSR